MDRTRPGPGHVRSAAEVTLLAEKSCESQLPTLLFWKVNIDKSVPRFLSTLNVWCNTFIWTSFARFLFGFAVLCCPTGFVSCLLRYISTLSLFCIFRDCLLILYSLFIKIHNNYANQETFITSKVYFSDCEWIRYSTRSFEWLLKNLLVSSPNDYLLLTSIINSQIP